jgi:hypothetical protein
MGAIPTKDNIANSSLSLLSIFSLIHANRQYTAENRVVLYVFPPPLHNNLHLIHYTKLAHFAPARLLSPHHNLLLDLPFPPPRCREPAAQSIRPDRTVHLKRRKRHAG